MAGNFFAIGKDQWDKACALGIGHAATFLVMARGTGRDNSTTSWSAEAAFKYAGISWRRAKEYIGDLEAAGILKCVRAGKRPTYKLVLPDLDEDADSVLWLPNTLVTGAAGEVTPVARLRQGQDIEFLQAFVELYGLQDLSADGGLPRGLIYTPWKCDYICDLGQYRVLGFNPSASNCYTNGPLARFHGKKDGGEHRSWTFLNAMQRSRLLEQVTYLAESDDPRSELIVALSGDEAALGVASAATMVADCLPSGFVHQAQEYEYALPVLDHLRKATLVGVFRLVYRPHTTKTAVWYARHMEACNAFEAAYRMIAGGEFSKSSRRSAA